MQLTSWPILRLLSWLLLATSCMHAQQIDVSLATFSPGNQGVENVGGVSVECLALRFEAGSVGGHVAGLRLSTGGTATLDAIAPVDAFIDDGDGQFDAGLDTLAGQGVHGPAGIEFTFAAPLAINASTTLDLWLRLNIAASAGATKIETSALSLLSSSDVTASLPVVLAAAVYSGVVTVVQFSVTAVSPDNGCTLTPLTIVGTGFTTPCLVLVGGMQCWGVTVEADGTRLSNVIVLEGSSTPYGVPLPIEIETDILGRRQITQTFTMRSCVDNSNVGSNESGCTVSRGHDLQLALWMTLTCIVALRAAWSPWAKWRAVRASAASPRRRTRTKSAVDRPRSTSPAGCG